jgi:hypothetical protein
MEPFSCRYFESSSYSGMGLEMECNIDLVGQRCQAGNPGSIRRQFKHMTTRAEFIIRQFH